MCGTWKGLEIETPIAESTKRDLEETKLAISKRWKEINNMKGENGIIIINDKSNSNIMRGRLCSRGRGDRCSEGGGTGGDI